MKLFPYAHATHPQWQLAALLVLAQLRSQMALTAYASGATLALIYITDHYADDAQDILDHLSAELPLVTDWSGTVGIGVAANNVEYFDEPGIAVMLLDIPADQYRVFSGIAPLGLGFEAHTALVHADGATPDLAELVQEMALRTQSNYLFGGVSSGRGEGLQFAISGDGNMSGHGAAGGVFSGGLSGVAFSSEVSMVSRLTQGCKPVSASRTITEADNNVVVTLDGEPALDVMLRDLSLSLERPQEALQMVRSTLVGLVHPLEIGGEKTAQAATAVKQTGNFGNEVLVRHIVGLDSGRRGIAVAEFVEKGAQLAFCQRNVQAAKADLIRICAEIREELEPEDATPQATKRILGAVYVSCSGRGGPHFGGPSAEMQIIRRALGDVPLVGVFAGGEIAYDRLYGYSGVLTVFTD
jgi:small ligand-binding sensory domain FIST